MCDDLVVSATLPLCQPPRRSERAVWCRPGRLRPPAWVFAFFLAYPPDAQQPPATISIIEIQNVERRLCCGPAYRFPF